MKFETKENLSFEKELLSEGVTLIAGMDEAGRGPLAGPVVAAAVIMDANQFMGVFVYSTDTHTISHLCFRNY